jgi:hypothetical protein
MSLASDILGYLLGREGIDLLIQGELSQGKKLKQALYKVWDYGYCVQQMRKDVAYLLSDDIHHRSLWSTCNSVNTSMFM